MRANECFTLNKTGTTYQNRAENCISQGALTNSKRPESLVKGIYPTHLKRGKGAYLWDEKGVKYLDYICGLGTALLGHSPEAVIAAILGGMGDGISLSLSSTLEVECAEMVKSFVPFIDKLKFFKNGSDACTAAVRFARAHTGRKYVLSEGYHGSGDGFVSMTKPASGIMDDCYYSDLNKWDQDWGDVACVILEPFNLDIGKDRIQWLMDLREKCTKEGVVLIFDEVITGMRVPGYTVSRYLGIEPDLICLGKAIASGMPLSVLGGPREIMDDPQVFYSQTAQGERLSLLACMATLQEIKKKDVNNLWEQGAYFQERFNAISDIIKLEGYPTRARFAGSDLDKALFFQESVRAGILFGPSFFYGFAQMEFDILTLSTVSDIIRRIEVGSVKLGGELPQSPFSQKVRDK